MIEPRKRFYTRTLADYVLRQIDPLVARQGFGEASLVMRWEEIVGARIAAVCQPMRLQWPPRPRRGAPEKPQEPATLALRVAPGFGLEIQHLAPTLIERVNAHLGWRCVARVTLRQEPLTSPAKPARKRPPPIDPALRACAEAQVAGVTDDALRAALVRLGAHALARREFDRDL